MPIKRAADRSGEDQLHKALLQPLLPDLPAESLEALAQAILQSKADDPINTMLSLLERGDDAVALERMLDEARDAALERLLPAVAGDAAPGLLQAIHPLLVAGDRLRAGLIGALHAASEAKIRQLHSQLVSEGEAHLLTKGRHAWEQSKGITLYNYYRELRFSAYVPLYKVEAHGLVTGRPRDLVIVVAAGEHGQVVHTLLPESDLCVRLIVEDTTTTAVHWRFGGILETTREKRREMRVQMSAPAFVVLRDGRRQWRGRVRELSAGGVGIELPLAEGLERDQQLACTLIMHMSEMEGEATIRWLNRHDAGARAGLELAYEPLMHAFLQSQLEREQQAVINELRLKGVPDAMAS